MSGTTSVPKPQFGPTGFIAPTEPDILVGFQTDIDAAFGGGLNPSLETPQGQLAMSLTAMLGDAYAQFVAITQNVDPAYSSGRMQDAIARIYFITRKPSLPTTVQALCTGLSGVQIPDGALAKSIDGNTFICSGGGTIGDDGTVTLTFTCTLTGPITCPTGTLNQIYQTVPGWDSITNLSDGVIGSAQEGRAAFEARRFETVSKNSVGVNAAILGAVFEVANVLDAYVIDNPTGSPVTLDGVTVPAFGTYVCVAGGDPNEVAFAAWSKKGGGSPWATANTTVTVTDPNPLYAVPPTYTVKFQTATEQKFFVFVNITNTSQVPGDAQAQIQPVVIRDFAGTDTVPRARIKSTVYATRYVPGIEALGSWARIVSIKLGSSIAPTASFTASIAGLVMTVTAVGAGTLAVGQFVQGVGVPDGVRIDSLGSGSGGTGTYNLNLPQTISSEAMTGTTPTLDTVSVGEAHVPVLAAANVVVNLV